MDYKPGQPGFVYANGYRVIDVKDKESCLVYARELGIDGVLTWGSTLTLQTVSYIGEALNLPCLPMEMFLKFIIGVMLRSIFTKFLLS